MSFGIPTRNGLGIGLLGVATLSTVNGGGNFTNWFLVTGVWDSAGIWIDAVAYPEQPFFLASGVWFANGMWIDDEVYP